MNYQRDDTELTKRLYRAHQSNPTRGDFVKLVKEDFRLIDKKRDETQIQMANSIAYKKHIKSRIKTAAMQYLKTKQKEHSKVRHIVYNKLTTQNYMLSPLFTNDEVNLLYALRSRATDCKANFKQKYLHTNLIYVLCNSEYEEQQHILTCKVLLQELKSGEVADGGIRYEDLFSEDVKKQKQVTALFKELLELRNNMVEKTNSQEAPSNTSVMLEMRDNVHFCIVNLSSGK